MNISVKSSTSTANSKLGIIRNTFHIIDREGFLILYKSNVRPILEYSISVWSPHLRKHDKEIEQIQWRATRLTKGFEHYSYPERSQELNLPTLYYRRCRYDVIQAFRIIKQIDHINSDSFFDLNLGITRKNLIYKLHKPRCNSTHQIHGFFSYRIIRLEWTTKFSWKSKYYKFI